MARYADSLLTEGEQSSCARASTGWRSSCERAPASLLWLLAILLLIAVVWFNVAPGRAARHRRASASSS